MSNVLNLPKSTTLGPFGGMWSSFLLSMRADNKSARTATSYTEAADQYEAFAHERGWSTDVTKVTRNHIREFIEYLLATKKPATASNRFRALASFFRWCVNEQEIEQSPMLGMKPPKVPEAEVPVIAEDRLRQLLGTCAKGNTFEDRRDHALMRVLIETGIRRAECAGLKLADVDLSNQTINVAHGKGDKQRLVALDSPGVAAIDRYLRIRAKHPSAGRTDRLWLGRKGPVTDSGVSQIIDSRCQQAGVGHIHVHQFRHTWNHMIRSAGYSDTHVMNQMGWSSPAMLRRYARTTETERALAARRELSPFARIR